MKGLNCWSVEEVAIQNRNYYLNGENFEKCDESCAVCLNKGNNCLECQMNYYFINGFKNGTCFFYPLEKYALGLVDGETVYLPCYSICKYCNQVSQSFLFQQCIECDEINYTLDLYSLNQSYCIPKNNINSYFIKDMEKWYIEDFEGIKDFEITNEKMLLDYQRLLQSSKFQNLTYKRVNECPPNKPYVIFSTRQCVSSCSSKNLIEHGIFMTKKLYEYNGICYDECPNGSEKDDINLTCKEINEYVKTNKTYTKEYYDEVRNDIILKYLGDDYAKKTVQYIRAPDFSSYHLEVTLEEEKISHMMELKVPIYNFSKCINKLIEYYHLNESENIYVEIMENNDINTNNIINSTSYKFFKDDGKILNHSCCENLNIEVKKNINRDYIDISFLSLFESVINQSLNISEIENDYCMPLSINGSDWTVEERASLVNKTRNLCDEGCSFISFDYVYNYSLCECKITEENNNIPNEIKEQVMGSEFMEKIIEILKEGNFKYFLCKKTISIDNFFKVNWIKIISILFNIIYIILLVLFFIKVYKSFEEIFLNRLRNLYLNREEDENNLIEDDNNNNNNNDDDEITEDFHEAKMKGIHFWRTYWIYLKQKLIIFTFFINDGEFYSKIFKFIQINIFLENCYFLNGLLLTEKYITFRKNFHGDEFQYAITKEYKRLILIIVLYLFIDFINSYFFNFSSKLEKADNIYKKYNNINEYKEKIRYLKKLSQIKLIIGFILVLIAQVAITFYISIFGIINSHSQIPYIIFYIITLVGFIIFYFIAFFFITFIRCISIGIKSDWIEILFKFSVWLADLFKF